MKKLRPKILKISGLNSFKEEQKIDFTRLTQRGLFGIFGPTGSGKSTILDAITIALYGEISRGTKEYINTDIGKLYVAFEFEAGSGKDRRTYKVERSVKQKDGGGISTDFVKFYPVTEDDKNVQVTEKVNEVRDEVTRIIGLNANDFTRSVVLPQGRFSEFLKLSGSDRRNMLERVLGLHKYGTELSKKIVNTKKEQEEKLNMLQGELNRYVGVSEEELKLLTEEFDEKKKEETVLKEKIEKLEENYEKYKKVWELQGEMQGYLNREEDLKTRLEDISIKRQELNNGRNAQNVIPYIEKLDKTNEENKEKRSTLDELEKKLKIVTEQLSSVEDKYEEAFERKTKELSRLIEKKSQINNSIDLVNVTEGLNVEVEDINDRYTKNDKEITTLKHRISDIDKNKMKIGNQIETRESKVDLIKITPRYRERLSEGWESEKKSRELKETHREEKEKIDSLTLRFTENNKELRDVNKCMEEKKEGLSKIETELSSLENDRPKDNDYISNKQSYVEKLKYELKEVDDLESKITELKERMNSIVEERNKLEGQLKIAKKDLEEKIEQEKNLNLEIDRLEKDYIVSIISSQLEGGKPCPVCGSTHHPDKGNEGDNVDISDKKQQKETILKEIEEAKKRVYDFELKINGLENERTSNSRILDEYIRKLDNRNSDTIRKDIERELREIEVLRIGLDSWEKKRNATIEHLDKIKEDINKLDSDRKVLTDRIKTQQTQLEESSRKLEETSRRLLMEIERYEGLKKELGLSNMEEKIEEVRKNDKILEELEKELRKNREDIINLNSNKDKLQVKLNDAQNSNAKLEESLNEKMKQIYSNKEKVTNICGDKEPEVYLYEVEALILKINSEEAELRQRKDKLNKEINIYKENRVGLRETLKILEDSVSNLKDELEKSIENNGFSSKEDVLTSTITKERIEILDMEISQYDEDLKNILNNIERLKKSLHNDSITKENWEKLKENKLEKNEQYNVLTKEIGQIIERKTSMEKDLESVKGLNYKIKKLHYTTDMLNDMADLIRGNRFVEYVAINHLKYIAKEASNRLMDITNSRYSLELDGDGNFVICDNYNGGVRRDCNTLSGGETFMTSLALALALSTQIQLKGKTSLEFFFLDEGFGTLDTNLLDVVMSSLEKLHREDLCVGIISHVEELKNRVPIKLEVTPAEAGVHGTRVEIKYS